ncbi:hypothetical protein FOCG_12779 [Fusarium oxysporum f. sp. radicis-lycopersici 26381]|uniref:Uncharacterized protein n=1 Tax=Fusarium oxysporum f. sp. narcissi TaxID=451672 RepID=A0A4V1RZ94_FUSOX|nr:hypothetical protein FOCG_12779 [Fusarium oxysporum f. sp. radicis-lycopersici 26381]RYC84316.1 hypothetical protein BFJ63_vAg12769 [Fusarium oxysporum f. sp. narcissi]
MSSPSSEASSRQRADATGDEEDEEDSIQFDEPSTPRKRVGSSERRVRQAMASAAHQTNAVWRDIFRKYSEEADELSS